MRAAEGGGFGVGTFAALDLGRHSGHVGVIAVVADAHGGHLGPVDAVDVFEEAVDEMLPELLAVGNDVDARIFLGLDPHQGGVALALPQLLAFQLPGRPELFRLGQPTGFGQTSGDGGFQHGSSPKNAFVLNCPCYSRFGGD